MSPLQPLVTAYWGTQSACVMTPPCTLLQSVCACGGGWIFSGVLTWCRGAQSHPLDTCDAHQVRTQEIVTTCHGAGGHVVPCFPAGTCSDVLPPCAVMDNEPCTHHARILAEGGVHP